MVWREGGGGGYVIILDNTPPPGCISVWMHRCTSPMTPVISSNKLQKWHFQNFSLLSTFSYLLCDWSDTLTVVCCGGYRHIWWFSCSQHHYRSHNSKKSAYHIHPWHICVLLACLSPVQHMQEALWVEAGDDPRRYGRNNQELVLHRFFIQSTSYLWRLLPVVNSRCISSP